MLTNQIAEALRIQGWTRVEVVTGEVLPQIELYEEPPRGFFLEDVLSPNPGPAGSPIKRLTLQTQKVVIPVVEGYWSPHFIVETVAEFATRIFSRDAPLVVWAWWRRENHKSLTVRVKHPCPPHHSVVVEGPGYTFHFCIAGQGLRARGEA